MPPVTSNPYGETEASALLDSIAANQMKAFEYAKSYTNIVVALGYAGFFAVWNLTKEQLSDLVINISATLICISILSFIIWEVGVMIFRSFLFKKIVEILNSDINPNAKLVSLRNQELKNANRLNSIYRLWYIALLLTVPTGFGAGIILLGSFIWNLLA